MVDPDQLAVALAIAVVRIFQGAQTVLHHQAAAPDRAGVEFDHHGGRVHHRLQVGVQGLQDHRPLRRMIDVNADAAEPVHPCLLDVFQVHGVVDVAVVVHVAPAHGNVGSVE